MMCSRLMCAFQTEAIAFLSLRTRGSFYGVLGLVSGLP
jgi:hypothetical protein